MKKFAVITTEGSLEISEVSREAEYDFLSKSVGGYIEAVNLVNPEATMWVNEEGKLNGLPINWIASQLWAMSYGATDLMVGDVVFTGGTDDEGETLGLSEEQISQLEILATS